MHFASFRSAAAFARRYALKLNASALVFRSGPYWSVKPAENTGVLYDPEIDAVQRAEGRARYLEEIAETIAFFGTSGGSRAH